MCRCHPSVLETKYISVTIQLFLVISIKSPVTINDPSRKAIEKLLHNTASVFNTFFHLSFYGPYSDFGQFIFVWADPVIHIINCSEMVSWPARLAF